MLTTTRRKFLRNISALPLLAAHAPALTLAHKFTGYLSADEPHIVFPSAPHERISVASYPFREFVAGQHDEPPVRNKKMPLKDFAPHVAAKFNIKKVEPWSEHFLSLEPGYLDQIRDTAGKAGCSFADIAADGENSLYSPELSERERAIQFGKTWIDVAARLGSPSVRINIAPVGKTKNVKPDGALIEEGLKPIAEYAAAKNIAVHLENDNPLSENPFFVVSVLDRVNSSWLHALPDFGNSLAALPAEEAYRALDQMFAHAYAISHVKDATTNPARVVVPVDVARIFALAKKHHYKGIFSMEFESEGDPYAGTKKLIAATVNNLS